MKRTKSMAAFLLVFIFALAFAIPVSAQTDKIEPSMQIVEEKTITTPDGEIFIFQAYEYENKVQTRALGSVNRSMGIRVLQGLVQPVVVYNVEMAFTHNYNSSKNTAHMSNLVYNVIKDDARFSHTGGSSSTGFGYFDASLTVYLNGTATQTRSMRCYADGTNKDL